MLAMLLGPSSTPARHDLDPLLAVWARVQRRLDEAVPYSPEWDAAMGHAEELERHLATLTGEPLPAWQ
jgi:hypothetical protein